MNRCYAPHLIFSYICNLNLSTDVSSAFKSNSLTRKHFRLCFNFRTHFNSFSFCSCALFLTICIHLKTHQQFLFYTFTFLFEFQPIIQSSSHSFVRSFVLSKLEHFKCWFLFSIYCSKKKMLMHSTISTLMIFQISEHDIMKRTSNSICYINPCR